MKQGNKSGHVDAAMNSRFSVLPMIFTNASPGCAALLAIEDLHLRYTQCHHYHFKLGVFADREDVIFFLAA